MTWYKRRILYLKLAVLALGTLMAVGVYVFVAA